MTKGVYLLHFNQPVKYDKANQYGDSRHYVGKSENIENRVYQHVSADGSEMTKAAAVQGIGFLLAATYPGDASDKKERYVQKNVSTLCIYCLMSEDETPVVKTMEQVIIKKKNLPSLKIVKDDDRVEWATPFTAKFNDHCDRCNAYIQASTSAAIVSGETICLTCVRPEERGNRLAHLK